MYLSKCIINGFKSFADKEEIEFKKGFSAIVGPNGCGKSNIYEAILWVLGEQRPTSLRSTKMEEVIFSGTSSRNPVGMAEVSLHIIDDERMLSDNGELNITRKLFRSGDSEYFLNKQQCRLKDITQLLTKVGLGKNSYAFIGQGEVNDILKAKPQDLRLMFEEAAGISEYKTQKFSTEAQLNKNKDSILRVSDLINEIQDDCQNLRARVELAKTHQKTKDLLESKLKELLTIQHKYLLETITNKDKSIQIAKGNIDDSKFEINNIESNELLLRSKRQEAFEEKQKLDRNLIQNESQVDLLTERKKELTVEVSSANDSYILSEVELNTEKNNLKGFVQNYQDGKNEKEKLTAQMEASATREETLSSEVSNIRESFNEKQHKEYDDKYQNLQLEIASLTQRLDSNSEEDKRNEALLEETLYKKKVLEEEIADLGERILNNKEEIETINYKYSKARTHLNQEKEKYDELQIKVEEIVQNVRNLNQEYHITKNKLDFYQQQKTEYSGYYNGVRFLMLEKSKSNNKVTGLIGPIAELITVNKNFQRAISEILGSRSQYLVCENARSATIMIDELKRNKAGKASFLPLDSLKGRIYDLPSHIAKNPAFLGRASEVITYSETIKPAVEQLLGNVLIFKTSQDVLALKSKSNQRFMIATLDGEIFYSSGIVSGGRNKGNSNQELIVRKGIIKELVEKTSNLKASYQLAEKKELELKSAFEKHAEKMQQITSELTVFENTKTKLNNELSKYNINLSNISERLKEAKQLVSTYTNRKNSLLITKQNLEELLKDKKVIYLEISNKIKKYNQIYQEVISKELQLSNLQSDLRITKNQIESLDSLICEFSSNVETTKKRVEKIEEELLNKENVVRDKKVQLEEISQRLKNLTTIDEELLKQSQTIAKKISSIDQELETYAISKRELNSLIDQMVSNIRELELNIASLETDLKYTEADIYQNNIDLDNADYDSLEISDKAIARLTKEVHKLEKENKSLGNIDYGAIEDLERKEKRLEFLQKQQLDLIETQDKLTSLIRKVDNLCINELGTTIKEVRKSFKFIFQDLFRGGSADIIWNLEDNIFESGIVLSASPPGKNVKNMNQLSGGEKALTAIALLLAFAQLRDSAFCIFDEVDSALDESNNLLLVDYLQEISKTSQVITITHSRHTMAHADYLYGVVMQEKGVSKVINVEMDKE